jgi:hypothetical protein
MKDPRLLPFLILLAALFSPGLFAQDSSDYHPWMSNRFLINVGVYYPTTDLKFSVKGTANPMDEEVDFEQALGLSDSESVFAMNFRWRFGEKWSLWAQYFSTSKDGTRVLLEDVEWEDFIFREGSTVSGGAGVKVARLFFGREFLTGSKYEFGAGAGTHWLEIDAFIEGDVAINDQETGFQRAAVDAAFPLPNIGAWYYYSFSKKLLFESRLDWLYVDIGDYKGGLIDAGVGLNFQAFKNVGFGLYYQFFRVDVDITKSDWSGSADLDFSGPFLSISGTW